MSKEGYVVMLCVGKVRSLECWENGYFSVPYTDHQHL